MKNYIKMLFFYKIHFTNLKTYFLRRGHTLAIPECDMLARVVGWESRDSNSPREPPHDLGMSPSPDSSACSSQHQGFPKPSGNITSQQMEKDFFIQEVRMLALKNVLPTGFKSEILI